MDDRLINGGLVHFLFPFSYKRQQFKSLVLKLQNEQYQLVQLEYLPFVEAEMRQEMVHQLKQFFYPFIQDKLFPTTPSVDYLNRFHRQWDIAASLQTAYKKIPFVVESVDCMVCPFETGIVNVTVRLNTDLRLGDYLDFIRNFRQLIGEPAQKDYFDIAYETQSFTSTEEFITKLFLPFLPAYFKKATSYEQEGYAGSLPYFEDERMFVLGVLHSDDATPCTNEELYRLARFEGRRGKMDSFIPSSNKAFIEQAVEQESYNRWAPHYYIQTTGHSQIALATTEFNEQNYIEQHYVSTQFYNLLIHYFYKIVLLKFSYEHSEIKWHNDIVVAEVLSEEVTKFYATYYFKQVAIRSTGQALGQRIREHMHIEEMFSELKSSVDDLYRVLEDKDNERYNLLLFILTIFTVFSSVIGMNLVVEELDGKIHWTKLMSYSFYEWITFLTGMTGLVLSFILITVALSRLLINTIRKKRL